MKGRLLGWVARCAAIGAAIGWPAAVRADEPRAHGSRAGAGDSRGPGQGDESGRPAVDPDDDASGLELPPPIDLAEDESLAFAPVAAYRLRYLHEEGRDFAQGGATNALRHRARLGLEVSYRSKLGARLEIQDVRTLGEERDPIDDFSADGLDMHQAYASFVPFDGLELRAGRQEIGLANERLVGVYDYLEQARSLDAVRVRYEGAVTVDGFAALVRADDVGAGAIEEGEAGLASLLIRYELLPALAASVLAVGERDERIGRRSGTAGILGDGTLGDGLLRYAAEGYYQFGRADGDVRFSAFLVGGRARVTLPVHTRPFAELHADFASGDADLTDNLHTSFAAPYGDAHAFFGAMDVFADLPSDTAEHGLRDLGATLGFRPFADLELRARHHLFQAMEPRGDLVHFGHELDLMADYHFWEHARASGAYGLFVPGSLIEAERGVPDGALEHHAQLTLGVSF